MGAKGVPVRPSWVLSNRGSREGLGGALSARKQAGWVMLRMEEED